MDTIPKDDERFLSRKSPDPPSRRVWENATDLETGMKLLRIATFHERVSLLFVDAAIDDEASRNDSKCICKSVLMTFARCLATLKEHFEIIMQRFDVQDALLNQMITRRVGSKGRKY